MTTRRTSNWNKPSSEETRKLNDAVAAATRELDAVNAAIPKTPVLRAVATEQSRETKIHKRGNFLDPGDVVSARLPEGLQFVAATASGGGTLTPSPSPRGRGEPDTRVDRLVFARWLTARENPLTARVLGQPDLGAALRHRDCRDRGGLRGPRNSADASNCSTGWPRSTATTAVVEEAGQDDRHEPGLPAVIRDHPRAAGSRSAKSADLAGVALPAARRNDSRSVSGCSGAALEQDGRAAGDAAAARWPVAFDL